MGASSHHSSLALNFGPGAGSTAAQHLVGSNARPVQHSGAAAATLKPRQLGGRRTARKSMDTPAMIAAEIAHALGTRPTRGPNVALPLPLCTAGAVSLCATATVLSRTCWGGCNRLRRAC